MKENTATLLTCWLKTIKTFVQNVFSIQNDKGRKIFRFLGFKIKTWRYKLEHKYFDNSKPTIAMQVDSMDKGGLEEVVLQLASNSTIRDKYNIVILTTRKHTGHLADIAKTRGISVIPLFEDSDFLMKVIEALDIKIVHFHYSLFGVETYKLHGVKMMYTIHNNYIWMDTTDIQWRSRLYSFIDQFVAVSSQVKDYFCEKFDIEQEKVKVITNGIEVFDDSQIVSKTKEEIGFNENDFVFINIASFNPIKYHFTQAYALSQLKDKYPQIKLLILANVPDREYHKQFLEFVKEHGVEKNIKIINYVPKSEVFSYLKMADSFIMTSLSEGFSIAMTEAMFAQKPMILTDVGGTRDVIVNNDIGIIVKHAFYDLNRLSICTIARDNGAKKYHFDNAQEIINALEDMFLNKECWSEKAKMGKAKVIDTFNSERVGKEYLEKYRKLRLSQNVNNLHDLREFFEKNQFDIAFVAPFPHKDKLNEGWMSRIARIDHILSEKKRLYINPFAHLGRPLIVDYSDSEFEVLIKPDSPLFNETLSLVVQNTGIIYTHTLHLAEYIFPVLDSGKVIVDIHGVTPEEEVMLGNAHLKEKYEKIEREVLKKAKKCIMVSNAMRTHYKNKYPDIDPRCTIFPIVENIEISQNALKKPYSERKKVIYSGGVQVWQNLESMLKLAKKAENFADFTFLSHDCEWISKQGENMGLKNTEYKKASKDELKEIYDKADFGLALRDASPVNFVCCPTKLYEYMACGIIPIVRTPYMGDFKELGFEYVEEGDFQKGIIPDNEKHYKMIENNFEVVKKMQEVFHLGCNTLLSTFSNNK